jgi:hypothetical protein
MGRPHRPQHELLIQMENPNIVYRVIQAMPLMALERFAFCLNQDSQD